MNLYVDPYKNYPKYHPQELRGTEGMKVYLISSSSDPYRTIACGQSVSWRPWKDDFTGNDILELIEGMSAGKIWAGQAFEAINFTFKIHNISRATTHQLVRIRIGAGFMQESGREGSWHKAQFITPLTILDDDELHKDYVAIMADELLIYERMIAKGVAIQDARFAVGHSIAQNMWMTINFRALMEWCSKRLCTTMQWEINTLARMIRDAVMHKYPHLGVMLKSSCERSGGCKSITPFYLPGAKNNGNRIYHPHEDNLCGKASGVFTREAINILLLEEKRKLSGV